MLLATTLFAALQDVPQRVVIERGGLENIALVGQAVTSLLVLVLLGAASLTLLALRRALDELTRLVRSTSSDITAAVHDAREVADELRRLTGRVRDTADIVRSGAQKVRRMVERSDAGAAPDVEERDGGRSAGSERPDASRERSERRRRKRRRPGDRPRREDGGSDTPPAESGPSAE